MPMTLQHLRKVINVVTHLLGRNVVFFNRGKEFEFKISVKYKLKAPTKSF